MESSSVEAFDKNAPFGHKLSPVLKYIGFDLEIVTPTFIQGRFVVTERSAQAFGVLHGGISAFIAESLASLGAIIASGLQRVAGVELSISHLKPAPIGSEIEVKVTPINIGRRLHVWEVKFVSTRSVPKGQAHHYNSSNVVEPSLFAISKLTVTVLPSKHATKSHNVESIPSKL